MDYSTILFLFCVQYCTGYSLLDESEGPVWPSEYHMQAEKFNMAGGILETMELWSSAIYNRSRFDFYDGLVKKYYHWKTEDRGAYVYSFMPTSTDEYQNKISCFKQSLRDDDADEADCLPKVEHYKLTGSTELEGRTVDIWNYEMVFEEKRWQERTLYTYRFEDYDVPVRFESKNFLIKNGAMTQHTITNFFDFEASVDKKDLEEGETDDCDYLGMLGANFPTDIKHLHPAKDTDVDAAFHSYKKHHGKNYDNGNEHVMRKTIFHETWEMIEHHNRQNLGYTLELNQFADQTSDDMFKYTGLRPGPPTVGARPFPHSDEEVRAFAEELPENFDLRMEGVISAVKNQAYCGSCWAFATAAAVEGALARSNGGRIVDLSEQSLVDCAWGWYCMGCDGGDAEMALHYVLEHGIPMEEEYGSYLEQDGLCHTKNMTTTYHIKGFSSPTPHNPEALKVAVYKYGPVAVSINFNKKMRYYSNGIFYDPECNEGDINHAVVVVGYGVRDGVDYWIIRNSHGYAWGQAGYILISAKDNNCFVLSSPIYPIL